MSVIQTISDSKKRTVSSTELLSEISVLISARIAMLYTIAKSNEYWVISSYIPVDSAYDGREYQSITRCLNNIKIGQVIVGDDREKPFPDAPSGFGPACWMMIRADIEPDEPRVIVVGRTHDEPSFDAADQALMGRVAAHFAAPTEHESTGTTEAYAR